MKQLIALLALSLVVISGCAEEEEKVVEGKLRIMYWDNHNFANDYGTLIASRFPELDYEVAAMNGVDDLSAFINEEQPDIIFAPSYEDYLQFIDQSLLLPLDPRIQPGSYDIEDIQPGVVQMLRSNEHQQLFGLSPAFSSQVLYYNKDLFKRYAIEEPVNQMTWEQVFATAGRFHTADDAAGFSVNYTSYDLVEMIGNTVGLRVITSNGEQIGILKDTEKWVDILEDIQTAVQQGSVALPGSAPVITEEMIDKELFLAGKSAMSVGRPDLLYRYIQSDANFDLGIVTAPVDPNFPDSTYSYRIDSIFGIHSASSMPDEAWEVIKLITGDEMAGIKAKYSNQLSTRAKYLTEVNGIALNPFYELSYDNRIFKKPNTSSKFGRSFFVMMSEELENLLLDKQSAEVTVKKIKEQGEVLLALEKD
ncbi:ABC transporter substrate-binding protein [Paenibacillus sambharensis]|uniref:ABC transporter substrate-binding protein n=1 Tax=Paenibacillus sambharensis TaxID=1803190 RepID=UPI0015E8C561|nr:extracellular solute-binding protein [Paenibacillus sambharensis]